MVKKEKKEKKEMSILEYFLNNPIYLVSMAKKKEDRFKSRNFKPLDAYYVREAEKKIISDREHDLESKRKYLDAMYNFAMKNNFYLFESELFSDSNIRMLYSREQQINIQERKQKLKENLPKLFNDNGYRLLSALIGTLDDSIMLNVYKNLLTSTVISASMAEFIVKYTLYLLGEKYQAFITEYNLSGEKNKTLTNIEFDDDIPILEFNPAKFATNSVSVPLNFVYETIKLVEILSNYEDIKNGKFNTYSFEAALELLFSKYLRKSVLKRNQYRKRQIHMNTKFRFTNFLTGLGFNKYFLEDVQDDLKSDEISFVTEKEIGYLNEIIENYPEELENFRILKVFYNEDGSKKTYNEIIQGLDDYTVLDPIIEIFRYKELAMQEKNNKRKKLKRRMKKGD